MNFWNLEVCFSAQMNLTTHNTFTSLTTPACRHPRALVPAPRDTRPGTRARLPARGTPGRRGAAAAVRARGPGRGRRRGRGRGRARPAFAPPPRRERGSQVVCGSLRAPARARTQPPFCRYGYAPRRCTQVRITKRMYAHVLMGRTVLRGCRGHTHAFPRLTSTQVSQRECQHATVHSGF